MPPKKKFTHKDVKEPGDLDRLNKDGLVAFLRSDREDKVATWNLWWQQHSPEFDDPERAIDLSSPCDLSNLNLALINLGYANLAGCNLMATDLSGSIFFHANLKNANLIGANLEWAILRNADLRHSALASSVMNHANLDEADLSHATLVDAEMSQATLTNANLEDAALHNACLAQSDLKYATLSGATLGKADLSATDLRHSNLAGSTLAEANLSRSNVAWACFQNADLRFANLDNVDFSTLDEHCLHGIRLTGTYIQQIYGLTDTKLRDSRGASMIWEDSTRRYDLAREIYKSLEGYFQARGDYEGANWAYLQKKTMEKLLSAPRWIRKFYLGRPGQWIDESCQPRFSKWVAVEIENKIAGHGLNQLKPIFWFCFLFLTCGLIYRIGGMVTAMPGCGYADLSAAWRDGCAPTLKVLDNLLFSLSTITTMEVGTLRPYLSHVGMLMTFEVLLGITLTGLIGFVLGNKLRNS